MIYQSSMLVTMPEGVPSSAFGMWPTKDDGRGDKGTKLVKFISLHICVDAFTK